MIPRDVTPPKRKLKVCVLGAGSFGTAMGFVAANRGHAVVLLARTKEQADAINTTRCNERYLKDFQLPENLTASSDAADALTGAELIIHAIPVQATPAYLEPIASLIPPGVPIVSTSKGIHAASCELMCSIFPRYCKNPILYLSGPSFAKELMRKCPTLVAMAGKHEHGEALIFAADALRQRYFRVYIHHDVVGLELAGACKNVVALMAGYIAGAELGANASAGVVTRAFGEVVTLGKVMGADLQTFLGLAGMGDLILTCGSSQSRNYTVGLRMAQGESLDSILASSTQVAEGVASAPAIRQLIENAGLGIQTLPILSIVSDVLRGVYKPSDAITLLLSMPASYEAAQHMRVYYAGRGQRGASRGEGASAGDAAAASGDCEGAVVGGPCGDACRGAGVCSGASPAGADGASQPSFGGGSGAVMGGSGSFGSQACGPTPLESVPTVEAAHLLEKSTGSHVEPASSALP